MIMQRNKAIIRASDAMTPILTGAPPAKKSWWDKALDWGVRTFGSGEVHRIQSDPKFQSDLEKMTAMRVNAHAGWERNPSTGKYRKAKSTAANTLNMVNRMENAASKASGDAGIPITQATKDSITRGVKRGVSKAIGWQEVLQDPRSAFQLWAKGNGHTGLYNFASDPTKFWGSLAIGAVGIPLIVSAFLSNRNNSGDKNKQTVINNYYGNSQVPPATTSFWRQPIGDNNNGIS